MKSTLIFHLFFAIVLLEKNTAKIINTMDTVHWVKITLNSGLTLFLLVVLFFLQFSLKPFQSGFYCNDYSINMKKYGSTVKNEVLVLVSLTFTFTVVFLSELVNKTHIQMNR